MQINERFIKLSSKLPVTKALELGDDIAMLIDGKVYVVNVVKIEQEDNQDGTMNEIYKLKFLGD